MKLYAFFPLFCQKFIWIPTRLILTLFAHLRISGLDNIKDIKGNAIFIMNHSSEIDPFIVPASLPFFSHFSPLFYATRERSFYSRNGWRKYMFGGLFINAWGGYTARAGLGDYAKSLVDHVEIMKDGYSFCIFPEGGITHDGMIRPAHGGVAYLAEVGQCPVVPVSVSGTYKTSVVDFFLGRRYINVHFGQPIYPDDLTDMRVEVAKVGGNVYKAEAQFMMDKIKEGMRVV